MTLDEILTKWKWLLKSWRWTDEPVCMHVVFVEVDTKLVAIGSSNLWMNKKRDEKNTVKGRETLTPVQTVHTNERTIAETKIHKQHQMVCDRSLVHFIDHYVWRHDIATLESTIVGIPDTIFIRNCFWFLVFTISYQ